MTDDLMTAPEVCAMLGRGRKFVLALIQDGLVTGYQRRGRWYVPRASLDAWLAGDSPTSAQAPPGPPRVWGTRKRRSS